MKPLVVGLVAMGVACTSTEAPTRAPYLGPPRPNVVLYLVDTLRADHLGSYGYDKPTSPRIDQFAQTGVLFEEAIAPDTCTVGSTPSLLTGQYTVTHGVDATGKSVSVQTPMLQTVLAEAGYETGSFITNVNAGPAVGLGRGFHTVHDAIKDFRDREALRTVPIDAIAKWLDGVKDRPFFLYVHTAEPHRPYTPPSPFRESFVGEYAGNITGVYRGPNGYENAREPGDVAHVRALYDGEVAFADAGFGSLLDLLDRRGVRDNTLVVLTSDHGEELYDRGGWNHGHTVHRELAHIPLIVSGPGVPKGQRVPTPVSLIDVAPAVLSSVEIPPPASVEGVSLWSPQAGRPLFTRSSFEPRKASIRHLGWTLIRDEHGGLSLYNQRTDPRELLDQAAAHPELVQQLSAQLDRWLAGQVQRPQQPLSSEQIERLKALGYIE